MDNVDRYVCMTDEIDELIINVCKSGHQRALTPMNYSIGNISVEEPRVESFLALCHEINTPVLRILVLLYDF